MQPDVELPPFVWLKVDGRASCDDFGINQKLNLVISERAFDVLDDLPSATSYRSAAAISSAEVV
ncbi:hypothetical protein ACFSQT_26735 [Mesorhizobium calcicola]|uniref:Transposase n=1 Tax=Mesorhizobium calcicola TaxID=1300310 RepID=A0ABW4WKQ9_9HYPH